MSDDYQTNLSFLVFISPKNLKNKNLPLELPHTPIVRNQSISQSRNFFYMQKSHRKLKTRIKTLPKNVQLNDIDSDAIKEMFCKKQAHKILTPRRRKIEIDKLNKDKVIFMKIITLRKLCILPNIDTKYPGSNFSVEKLFLKSKRPRLDDSVKLKAQYDDLERYKN